MNPRILGALGVLVMPVMPVMPVMLAGCSLATLGPPGSEESSSTGSTTGDGSTTAPATTTTTDTSDEAPTECVDLEPRVLQVFAANCAKCHGPGSLNAGGIDYILDLEELVLNDKIEPGDPENSRVYQRMTMVDSPMPPWSEAQRPTESDIESVRRWIVGCSDLPCSAQPFISRDELLTKIHQDLNSGAVDLGALPYTRYFTFVHLRNAGWCDSDIEVQRQALSEAVNGLSRGTQIVQPQAVDDDRLIFRVDIRDHGWDIPGRLTAPSHYFPADPFVDDPADPEFGQSVAEYPDLWAMISHQNPYTIAYPGELADAIAGLTETGAQDPAIAQADAFIDAALRAPLYYDILGIPPRIARLRASDPECAPGECLEQQLGLTVLGDILAELIDDKELVARAALHQSLVSDFPRVVERHRFADVNNRVLWLTYDFDGVAGEQNPFTHPLDFLFDSVEVLYTLPNGMPGHALAAPDGTRIAAAPIEIVQDTAQNDFKVRAAASCLGCHQSLPIRAQDDLRFELDAGMTAVTFSVDEKDKIRRLYSPREEFDDLIDQDIDRFADALDQSGVPPDAAADPSYTALQLFDQDVDLRRAAAELMSRELDLLMDLGKLDIDLYALTEENGVVLRQLFTARFAESACILNLGATRACPASDPP
jgi:mono/diheme cytochrome c family protein